MADTQHTHEPPAAPRVHIRKIATLWHVACPCGYIWATEHHRLALLFATQHTHGWAA